MATEINKEVTYATGSGSSIPWVFLFWPLVPLVLLFSLKNLEVCSREIWIFFGYFRCGSFLWQHLKSPIDFREKIPGRLRKRFCCSFAVWKP
jgi:hypothetical protein